jgi:formate dehydrogenase major subunit
MATKDSGHSGAWEVSRRDFLKTTTAAAVAAGCGLSIAYDPEKAAAYEDNPDYTVSTTTCPYCSASCGQRVVVDASNNVVDIYGDFESPMNSGGLCAKGAGSLQLVNNRRRIGAFTGTHPANSVFAADGTSNGVAYKRTGNGAWAPMDLQLALDDIADGMVAARNADAAGWAAGNSKSVAFFGSSHLNNEPNYVYRKLIANFGTSNVEHQARI